MYQWAGEGEKDMTVLGIDPGGTKIALGLMNLEGKLLCQTRYSHRKCPTEEWVQELLIHLDSLLNEAGTVPEAIGIGARGHVDYNRQLLMSATHMMLTEPLDLCGLLAERYHCPVFIDNDAKAAATRELLFGIGRCCDSFVCYTVGTGIGTCAVMDRRPLRGDTNFTGEIGYDLLVADPLTGTLPAEISGVCLENIAGGAAIQRAYQIRAQDSGVDLFAGVKKKDDRALQILRRCTGLIAVSVYNLHNLLDISHFVFSGGVAGQEGFLDAVEEQAQKLVAQRPGPKKLYLSLSSAGSDDAGLVGAASVALYRL